MAPTYLCRFPGSPPTAFAAPHFYRCPTSTETCNQQKPTLRSAALALRDALPAAERQAAAETIAARPFPVTIAPGAIVSGFSPMKTEINPIPLMRKLADAGAQLALPAIAGRGSR